jgi:hypothetical protein
LCKECGHSANLGIYVFVGVIVLVVLMLAFNWLFG